MARSCDFEIDRAPGGPSSPSLPLIARNVCCRNVIFWLKDESLEDSANLPDPDVIAAEIAEDLQAALDQVSQIASDLKSTP